MSVPICRRLAARTARMLHTRPPSNSIPSQTWSPPRCAPLVAEVATLPQEYHQGLLNGYGLTVGRTWTWSRSLTSDTNPISTISYEELKKLLVNRTGVVIDVREPWELREYGSIPGSINVPLEQVKCALQLKPEDFRRMYGGEMPSTSDNVVFSCLAGVRSAKAMEAALSVGYSNAQQFPGGWKEWAEKEMLPMK